MKTITKRLRRLELLIPLQVANEDDWGRMVNLRDEVLHRAEQAGEPRASEIREELERIGPTGLWSEMARIYLANHGFAPAAHESFAETMARALDIGIEALQILIANGQIGTSIVERFG